MILVSYCLLPTASHRVGDIEFPPNSNHWYRPGPLFESRVLGRWPTQGSASVWSEAMWEAALIPQTLDPAEELVIGCDVARFGDDFTSIVVRRGNCVLHHETHNGWKTTQTAGRLKQLAAEHLVSSTPNWIDPLNPEDRASWNKMDQEERRQVFGAGYRPPETTAGTVAINVDDAGVGGGVVDQGDDQFWPISGAKPAVSRSDYPNRRSELWFVTAERADERRLDLSRLSPESLKLIQRQLMAPTWKLDSQGRRVVEPKSETKRRIGRSPDDADALNLAFTAIPRIECTEQHYYHSW